jgi:RNA polymerase sigma-70 factor (ECF subfamily)
MEFADLARQQLPRLYSLARQLVDDEAEDLVQECLLRAYRGYGELRDVEAAPAWLNRILVNCARDRFRARQRRLPEAPLPDVGDFSLFRTIATEDPFPYSDSLHLDFLCRFGPEDVWAVLRGLPELYRVPLAGAHAGCRDQTGRAAARDSARHPAGAFAPRSQTVRAGPVGLRGPP